ncbi:MAG: glycosyltransferase family 2 protein, partial [bacterium]
MVSSNPLVSVIIPTYNRLEMVKRAIDSVRRQSYNNREIIVVDDGSNDGTSEYLNIQDDIKALRQGNNGVSSARNTGITQSSGEWVAFLDSDDE